MIRTAFLALCVFVCAGSIARAEQPLLIFAAASMTNAVQDIADAFAVAGNGETITVFDATSRAARQIQQGAPAHVLLSANSEWAAWLVACGPGDPSTRRAVAANGLVLIGGTGGNDTSQPRPPASFNEILRVIGDARLAIADPFGVPAGIYAREALIETGAWERVQPKLVQGDTVRTVLNWVRTGTAEAGIVYATDARMTGDVQVLSVVPASLHDPIVYEAVAVKNAPPSAHQFIAFLTEPRGQSILSEYGFAAPPPAPFADNPTHHYECR